MGFVLKSAVLVAFLAAGAVYIIPRVVKSAKHPLHFGGHVEKGFEKVDQVFRQNYEKGYDTLGSSFSVCHKGKIVVDIFGGYANDKTNEQWKKDTMAVAFSTTKAICALCLAVLVDRGEIDYDSPVTKYWPEFGKQGKSKVTVKMLASHEAGLVNLSKPITVELIKDWKEMGKVIENQVPNWSVENQGVNSGYHAFTFGFLIDQLVRRVDPHGRSLGQFFHDEIAKPHNVDFYIGLPKKFHNKVAKIKPASLLTTVYELTSDLRLIRMWSKLIFPNDLMKSIADTKLLQPDEKGDLPFNGPDIYELEIGAANGIGTSVALAKLFCLLDNENFINKTTVDRVVKPVFEDHEDLVIGLPVSHGHGFWHAKNPNGKYALGHPGYGGQNVKYDPEYHLSFAYLRNGMSNGYGDLNRAFSELENALYEIILQKS